MKGHTPPLIPMALNLYTYVASQLHIVILIAIGIGGEGC